MWRKGRWERGLKDSRQGHYQFCVTLGGLNVNLGQSFVPLKTNIQTKTVPFQKRHKSRPTAAFCRRIPLTKSWADTFQYSWGSWAGSPLCDSSKPISRRSLATLSSRPLFKTAASQEWRHPGGTRTLRPPATYAPGKFLKEHPPWPS